MPSCGLFHDFELTPEGNGSYLLRLALEGDADVKRLFEDCGLASRVDHLGLSVPSRYSTGMRLSDVVDYHRLSVFCNYSRSTIIVDLMPYIDHCFALGPYTLFLDSSPSHSEIGNLVNRAKYDRDPEATNDLSDRLQEFIDSHPILSSSTVIAAPPGAVSSPLNLPLHWAKVIANQSGYELITPMKTRETIPQKDIDNIDDEGEVVARIEGSMVASPLPQGSRVLMLDDTIRSGGTLIELSRALRQAGAERVYGLSAAKDAKFTLGGINLDRDSWQ